MNFLVLDFIDDSISGNKIKKPKSLRIKIGRTITFADGVTGFYLCTPFHMDDLINHRKWSLRWFKKLNKLINKRDIGIMVVDTYIVMLLRRYFSMRSCMIIDTHILDIASIWMFWENISNILGDKLINMDVALTGTDNSYGALWAKRLSMILNKLDLWHDDGDVLELNDYIYRETGLSCPVYRSNEKGRRYDIVFYAGGEISVGMQSRLTIEAVTLDSKFGDIIINKALLSGFDIKMQNDNKFINGYLAASDREYLHIMNISGFSTYNFKKVLDIMSNYKLQLNGLIVNNCRLNMEEFRIKWYQN